MPPDVAADNLCQILFPPSNDGMCDGNDLSKTLLLCWGIGFDPVVPGYRFDAVFLDIDHTPTPAELDKTLWCQNRQAFRKIWKNMPKQMTGTCDKNHCPLCRREDLDSFFEDKNRIYLRCRYCKLVFVPKSYWLSAEDEKAVYDLHENDAHDEGYRQFLSRLSTPLLERLNSRQKGLDFGCGPGPTLSVLLEERGQQVDLYDPFYFNDPSVFDKKYDFICATEVVEHLRDPLKDFTALFKMLNRGGWLGIMTKLVIDEGAFSQWHYIRDMTHVCFYSRSTFEYLAQRFNAELDLVANDLILLNKK